MPPLCTRSDDLAAADTLPTTAMHLEVKVALNFIVSYLYNKLPRRRADLFGEELERLLVSRFEGHWYPEAPLRGSAFRCLHLGAPRDPVVELAAQRSGLDTEEVRANVPPELSVWIDPYEVSYQIGEKGAVKVLYLEDPPGLGGDGERAEGVSGGSKGEMEVEEGKSLGFNPDAQVFVPIGGQRMLSRSPTTNSPPGLLKHKPLSLSLHSLGSQVPSQLSPNAKEFVYPASPASAVGIIGGSGGISYMEKPPFVEGLGGYNLQYPSQAFQPVVLAN
ncbi:hypothetical protein MATL_G00217240 [Megalops atlanticus]|uniref:Anti-proliferative protein domain-containing protein n=1 Tax=Megalops atlanticus TaxID=7932 RepID=A0A9D3PKT1_MEGAT|nr:hypothetical protein MATL_G00217240 [Megalops atlanticus]